MFDVVIVEDIRLGEVLDVVGEFSTFDEAVTAAIKEYHSPFRDVLLEIRKSGELDAIALVYWGKVFKK